jgi:uncharacterized protein
MAMHIEVPRTELEAFCKRNKIVKLALFGSVLRDDFTSDSDIDVLVEFEPSARIGFFELYDIEQELSDIFGGRKVDINTPKSISRYFRNKVLTAAEVQYVRP